MVGEGDTMSCGLVADSCDCHTPESTRTNWIDPVGLVRRSMRFRPAAGVKTRENSAAVTRAAHWGVRCCRRISLPEMLSTRYSSTVV
jgi:hypothetical protein